MQDVKVVATIPDGVVYGELEADYYKEYGKYDYNLKEEIKEKTIEIGDLKTGESKTTYYEVKVKDLGDEEENKEILTTIDSYVGNEVAQSYQMKNTIEPGDVKVLVQSRFSGMGWAYGILLSSQEDKEVTVKMHLPKQADLQGINYSTASSLQEMETAETWGVYSKSVDFEEEKEVDISDDNVVTVSLKTNLCYSLYVIMDTDAIERKANESTTYVFAYAEVFDDNKIYHSNENRMEFAYNNVEISISSPTEGETVTYGDEVDYEITVKNIGRNNTNSGLADATLVNVSDFIPEELAAKEIIYDKWETEDIYSEESDADGNKSIIGMNLNKVEGVVESIEGRPEDENGNRKPDVDVSILIPYGETTTIKVKTKADIVNKETKIQNSATVSGDNFDTKKSNIITHTLRAYNAEEIELPEDTDDEDDSDYPIRPSDPSDPYTPSESDDPSSSDGPSSSESQGNRCDLSGLVWLDDNEDGIRTSQEELLDGITVMLVNAENINDVKRTTKTQNNGEYKFTNIEKGKYLVVFQYDTSAYEITEYKKKGATEDTNSDVVDKKIKLNNMDLTVGLTDTIELNESLSNIDMGLTKNKKCDIKVDKYVSKISVKTVNGTKQYSYNNEKLAKIEIVGKELKGATVTTEYKIVVTNVGEIAGRVGKVIDYLPDGVNFVSNINKDWGKGTNNQVVNTSLANKELEVGESAELILTTTQTMTEDTTGTYRNKVEIQETSSIKGKTDINANNDSSQAEVLISIKTGAIFYTTTIIATIIILSVIIILLQKKGKINFKKINKATFIAVMFALLLVTQCSINYAEEYWFMKSIVVSDAPGYDESFSTNDRQLRKGSLWSS